MSDPSSPPSMPDAEDTQGQIFQLLQYIAELEAQLGALQQLPVASLDDGFQDKLKILNELSLELDRANTVDDVCRLGIEYGMARLGFDRLGLWLLDEDRVHMVGTFGVDEAGNLRDERHQRFSAQNTAISRFDNSLRHPIVRTDYPLLNDQSQMVGMGWHISVPLLDGDAFVGFLSADNLLHQHPLKPYEPELLRLYGITLGYLCMKKREQERARRLLQAIQNSSSCIVLFRENGIMDYANPSFKRLFGMEYAPLQALSLADVLSHTSAAADYASLWESLQKGEEWLSEVKVKHASGASFTTLLSITPVTLNAGKPSHYVMVQEDISAQKEAEKQLLALALEKEHVHILRRFISDFAHDFKTPLTLINTSTYLAQRLNKEPRIEAQLHTVQEQSSFINHMLDDMLLLMRLETDEQLDKRLINLSALIHQSVSGFSQLAQAKNIRWRLSLQRTLMLNGNFKLLTQVMYEIIENALLFSSEDQTIELSCYSQAEEAIVIIQDHGIGIEPEEIPLIIQPFYRADKSRTARGTGLGLAIAKRIVEHHGGSLHISSQVGVGTRVELRLPHAN